jgi:dihydroorotate dehydrogenase
LAVKLSPDLAPGDLEAAVDSVVAHGLDGIVAVNTSRARSGLVSTSAPEAGGLSGRPLWSASRQMIEVIRARGGEAISVIGVGGIDSPERAMQMLDSGADLIQVYTGLIYEGPGLPASMLKGLAGRTAEGHILERASSPSTRLA